jgi:hypothetical protein
MLSRPRVCPSSGSAKVPLITARGPADLAFEQTFGMTVPAAPER